MIRDKFADYPDAPGLPATRVIEIEPDDDADLPEIVAGINVETPGTVRVTTKGGTAATVFVTAGIVFPLRVTRVWATDTSATGIRGLV